MLRGKAHIREVVSLQTARHAALPAAWISCPKSSVPAPGRYLLATAEDALTEPLATVLFAAGYSPDGFLAAPPIPIDWMPGQEINLHGPFGHGFALPNNTRRLALAGTANPLYLLALLPEALREGMDIAMFCDDPPAGLPSSVEVTPLAGLPEGLRWADFLAAEVPQHKVDRLPAWIGPQPLCPAEVLVVGPMPCAGLASCGVCAVNGRRGPLLVCESGPVFSLAKLWR
jgi:hypothetical protein